MAGTREDNLIGTAFPNAQVGQSYNISGKNVVYQGTDKQPAADSTSAAGGAASSNNYESGSNKKLPAIKYEGNYPNFFVVQGIDGYQLLRSLEPGKESLFEIFPSGSYRSHGPNGEEVRATVDTKHEYVANNYSHNVDGQRDNFTGGTSRTNVGDDDHHEVGGSLSGATRGVHIQATQGSHIQSQTEGDKFLSTEGNVTTDHTGDTHASYTGDYVITIQGNRHETVSKGDSGYLITDGSYDIRVQTGQIKAYSPQKITLVVGGSEKSGSLIEMTPSQILLSIGDSSITMTRSGIVLKGVRIDLNP